MTAKAETTASDQTSDLTSDRRGRARCLLAGSCWWGPVPVIPIF